MVQKSFNWTCPYCKAKATIVVGTNYHDDTHYYHSLSKYDGIALITEFIVCQNFDCKELVIHATLKKAKFDQFEQFSGVEGGPILKWTLKPESNAKPLPDYIPEGIKNDYYEACRILTLSPKASATLARRCLQGMIRDFWN